VAAFAGKGHDLLLARVQGNIEHASRSPIGIFACGSYPPPPFNASRFGEKALVLNS
jgi:hypothetical protein